MLKQRDKIFRQKLKDFATAVGALDAFNLIPETEIDLMVKFRFRPLYVELHPEAEIHPKYLSFFRGQIADYMKKTVFTVIENGPQIKLQDFSTVGMTLDFSLSAMINRNYDKFDQLDEIIDGFSIFFDFISTQRKPYLKLKSFITFLGWSCSYLEDAFCWFDHHLQNAPPYFSEKLILRTQKADVRRIKLDGKTRPAYRVGRALTDVGVEWVSIRPIDLGLKGAKSKMPMCVYIQSHALDRLYERIDNVVEPTLQIYLFLSLIDAKLHIMKDGTKLIEYYAFGIKMGYLVFEIVDDIILIRTFLFLTNDGTPEGERLKKNNGLEMLGKQYLKIDRMSTFSKTDFKSNEKTAKLFADCGCGHLLEQFDKEFPKQNEIYFVNQIVQYLGLE